MYVWNSQLFEPNDSMVRFCASSLPSKAEVRSPADVGLTLKDIHEAREISDAEEAHPGSSTKR